MMLLILQNNCDEFWSWSWAYPIICAFILGVILGWLFGLIFGGNNDKKCKCCEGVKAELEACRSNNNILTSRETKSADFRKKEKEALKKASEDVKVTKLNVVKSPKKAVTKKVKVTGNSVSDKTKVTKKKTVIKKIDKPVVKKVKPIKKTVVKKEPKKVTKLTVVKSNKKDDLTKVEGIGPKIQELFNNDGIYTWKQLSTAKIIRLQEILEIAGPRYRIHNPASWTLQAAMCAKGEWEELKKWQDEHKRGRL